MLKKILLSLAIFVALFLMIGFFLPRDFRVHRSISIEAPRQVLHEALNDLSSWSHFMPWNSTDSNVEFKLGEIKKGVGATQTWSSSGGGRLTLTKSDVQTGIEYEIVFSEGADRSVGDFRYQDITNGTTVSWSMAGRVDAPLGGYVTLLMDDMIGTVFEQGLVQLKNYLENAEIKVSAPQK